MFLARNSSLGLRGGRLDSNLETKDQQAAGVLAVVPALQTSPTQVECVSPSTPAREPLVTLRLTTNGQDLSGTFLSFRYTLPMVVHELRPASGPSTGGTTVQVIGSRFEQGHGLSCLFGRQQVAASFISTSVLACRAPAAAIGGVPVSVSHNGFDFVPSAADAPRYTYVEPFAVRSIHPSFGPVEGGTRVTVRGGGFASASMNSSVTCRFGDSIVEGIVLSDSELECNAPASPNLNRLGGGGLGSMAVAVSFNGRDFTETMLQYRYVPSVVVLTVFPRIMVEGVGSRMRIRGDGFIESSLLECRFEHTVAAGSSVPAVGNSTAPARFISPQEVSCDAPGVPQGVLRVRVSNNGRDNAAVTDSAAAVSVVPQLTLAASPTAGSVFGGTHVQLRVSGFPAALETRAYCVFDRIRVAALALQQEPLHAAQAAGGSPAPPPAYTLECIAPAAGRPGFVDLRTFAGGADPDLAPYEDDAAVPLGSVQFEYTSEPVLHNASSGVVFASTGGNTLVVHGQDLLPASVAHSGQNMASRFDGDLASMGLYPSCRFHGAAWNSDPVDAPTAAATFINQSAIRCTVPGGLEPGRVTLQYSMTGQASGYTQAGLALQVI